VSGKVSSPWISFGERSSRLKAKTLQVLDALVRLVRSSSYRRLLGELPGYDTAQAGEIQSIKEAVMP
jgi:hypothetical protein